MKALLTATLAIFAMSANAEIFDHTGAVQRVGNQTIQHSLDKIEAEDSKKQTDNQLKTYDGFLEFTYRGCLKSDSEHSANEQIKLCKDLQQHLRTPTNIAPGKLLYILLIAMNTEGQTDTAKREANEIITRALLSN